MYNDHFGFSAAPFRITPNIDFLFMSLKHKQAVSCMEFALVREIGLMIITGEIGTGKTTLIRHFLEQLEHIDENARVAYIFNTNVSSDQLLALILQELEADVQTDSKAVAIQALQRHLQNMRTRNLNPLLIIDDAQNLSHEALEEVRLLSNLQDGHKPLVQIMLIGQSELKARLSSPGMASFAQRIGVSYHLQPLTKQETHEYIKHRLQTVGGRGDLFTREAVDLIHETTDGTPRAINMLCDHSLVYGFADDLEFIDVETAKKVAEEFGTYLKPHPQSAASQAPADGTQAAAGALNNAEQLEARLTSIERMVDGYIKEFHGLLKTQLSSERKRSDKLLMEYTRLKTRLDPPENQADQSGDKAENPSQESQQTKKKGSQSPLIVSRLKAMNSK
jgi:general secretion pathway protein A